MHARWVFLPVLGAPLAHAPVLKLDLLSALNRPLDGGRTVRGRRVFGDNKTWRGAVVMSAGVLACATGLHRSPWYRERLPSELRGLHPAVFGGALAVATVAGELPNSFLKRRLGVAPGAQHPSPAGVALAVFDQADFVPGVWLLLRPFWRMSARQALDAFFTVAAVHAVINVIGYAIGARETFV